MRADRSKRRVAALVAMALLTLAAPGQAIAPLLVLVGKQIVQDTIFNAVKGKLIASLAGMGCKGARLAGLVATASGGFHPGGGLGAMSGLGSKIAAGGLPPGMPPGVSMPNLPGGAAVAGGSLPSAVSIPNMPSMPAAAGAAASMPVGQAGGVASGSMGVAAMSPGSGPDMSQLMKAMQASGDSMTPDQMAHAQDAMRRMQLAMAHPLTRAQTLEVFDQLKGLGVLTEAMHGEARDCILLAPDGSDQMLGQTGAVFKELVLPQLQETKAKMANLGPEEQEQLAQGIAQALRDAAPSDRDAFREGLGAGFFPQSVVEKAVSLAR